MRRLLPDESFGELGRQRSCRLRMFALEIVEEKEVEQHEPVRAVDHVECGVEDLLFDVANALVIDPGPVGEKFCQRGRMGAARVREPARQGAAVETVTACFGHWSNSNSIEWSIELHDATSARRRCHRFEPVNAVSHYPQNAGVAVRYKHCAGAG